MKTTYHIEASFQRDGQILDCTQAEVLGDAYGEEYSTLEEAIEMCDSLQSDLASFDLDESTEYSVYDAGQTQVYSAK